MNLIFGKTGLAARAFILCAMLFVGCRKPPVMPVDINSDDSCYFCKSPIAEPEFAAEFLTADGSVYKFDDIACMIASARVEGKKNIKSFYVMDAQSRTWAPAEQAQFVRSDKLRTPKNGGLVAFKDAAKARDLASRYQAELVKFDDLVK
jgi:copper chaperone NosL